MTLSDFAPAADILIAQFYEKNWSVVFVFLVDGKNDGACFDDVLGERLDLATIAVHAERNPALTLNLHRIINVNRLAIEKHLVPKDLRQRLCVIKAHILDEFLMQLWTENVPVSVDDTPGCLGLSQLNLLKIADELAVEECLSNRFCHLLFRT